jgi:hypothetical protein
VKGKVAVVDFEARFWYYVIPRSVNEKEAV